MRRINLLLLFSFVSVALFAVPARQIVQLKQLVSGEVIEVELRGDEYLHGWVDNEDKWYSENPEGLLVPMAELEQETIEEVSLARRERRRVPALTTTAYPRNLAPRGLIILANFKDVKFNSNHTLDEMRAMHVGTTYTESGAEYKTSQQYFIDQSSGLYNPQFDVVGPVELPQKYAYYGTNDSKGYDLRADSLIAQSCRLAHRNFKVNFSRYDNNNDGYVDFVYVIYAGYNEAEGANANTIWPHNYWLYQGYHVRVMLDGKIIDTYACSSELQGKSGNIRSGIGTFCHEFSHVLGLPDLYTTNEAKHKTMGAWDILDYGPYNNNGYTPPAYSAYERFFMNWLSPQILNSACSVQLNDLQSSNSAVLISSTGVHNKKGNNPNPNEFYLLENRQQYGWDEFLPGSGMLITRVKYDYALWYANTVNDEEATMGVDIIEADGVKPTARKSGYFGKPTDLFPAGATEFTAFSYPITNIEMNDEIVLFDFMGGGNLLVVEPQELGIRSMKISDREKVIGVYDLLGNKVAGELNNLPKGIYVVVSEEKTSKLIVK